MTDDQWRRRDDEDDDFGPPLFADDDEGGISEHEPTITFGDGDTGPLPHWTQPPTGEMPRVLAQSDETDDLDVWSSFSTGGTGPTWREDRAAEDTGFDDITGLNPVFEDPDSGPIPFEDLEPTRDDSAPIRREPGRITIGTDPTDGAMSRPAPPRRGRPDPTGRGPRPAPRPAPSSRPQGGRPSGGTGGRDMPTAVFVGLLLAVVFIGALKWKPIAVGVIVIVVLGLAAVEYFDRVNEKGYQPAVVPGIMACVAAPTAVYFYGIGALPLVLFLAFVACAATFVFSGGLESNPMPNMAITTLGLTWIGLLGSFGAAIVALSNEVIARQDGTIATHVGTDTLCLLAIGVVANDVGALFWGSALGRTPLRGWISPNKTVEGFLGGTLMTLVAMFLVGVTERSTTWNSTGDLLILGLVIAVTAPLGDLTESMFKRNLDVKDFGSIVKGHGGVLDRFDGFLFTLPAVYYLTTTLQPWFSK